MVSQGVTDIDVLVLAVRDRESRRLIVEAITAYRGGALRSSIMSTWVAVAYDIIAKARELEAQGDATAGGLVQDLDAAIHRQEIRKLQTIESGLLKFAADQLQLLAPHEFASFDRLQKDRNLCAHPAFIVEDELYQPTLELVRAHIVHALQYLLIHAPLQGKSAITRFDTDIASASFPSNAKDIGTYIRAKYLDRAKDVLVTNLIKALFSAPFGNERLKYSGRLRRLALTLGEISKAKTALYEATVPSWVARKFDLVGDDTLLSICPLLDVDSRIWNWLSEPARLRIRQLLATAAVEDLKLHSAFDAFSISELGEILVVRFKGFDRNTQISLFAEHPKREFVGTGISIYSGARSYSGAEALGQSVIVPLAPHFLTEDIRSLLVVVEGNGQIWNASGTPPVLEAVFDSTRHLLSTSRVYWQLFVDDRTAHNHGNASDYYSYPGLRERLAALLA